MSKNFACVFPGQGSQSLGMLAELAESYPIVRKVFTEASDVLGYDLWKLSQEGPQEALDSTEKTQPALLAASVAVWEVWQQIGGPAPSVLAGHSLGEYSALVCSGALDYKDGINLVAKRGALMQQAVASGIGAMAAIIGLDNTGVQALCETYSSQEALVAPANFNSPGQVVISGHTTAVNAVVANAKSAGAKMAKVLAVSVPSHSPLMATIADTFAEYLAELILFSPKIPVVNNVDVAAEHEPEKIKSALIRQLYSPVHWVETVEKIIKEYNVQTILEFGPGKVLTGLNKRIDRDMELASISEPTQLGETLKNLQ